MRQPFIAGNWKMNLTRQASVDLVMQLAAQHAGDDSAEVAVCPPYPYLDAVARALRGSSIALGAQNMYHEASGAYTGEVSAGMLMDVGCRYVILGHSERRQILGETDAVVNLKLRAALQHGLTPIVCVGETLEQREADRTQQVVRQQATGSLAELSAEQMVTVVLAYEPVWAIGTGRVATPEQAEQVHADLRSWLTDRYNAEVAGKVRIQYGGSVKPDNAAELMAQANIDGALVGGASLQAESFLGIIRAASSSQPRS